jgi:hypothetical protein
MIQQEFTALGLAAVVLVTNFLGAWFTIRRVYSKWAESSPVSLGHIREPAQKGDQRHAASRRQSAMVDDRRPKESPTRALMPEELWQPLYPRSTYWTVNPLGRLDFSVEFQVDGKVNRVTDWRRITETYLPRFATKTNLSSYNVVLFLPDQDSESPERVPEQVKDVLTRFRAIVFAARVSGVSVDLSKVRLYLHIRKGGGGGASFSVGEMDINGRRVPFGKKYVAPTQPFHVAKTILDDRVTMTFDQNEVELLRTTAEQLSHGVPALSIEDAEAKWGRLLPMPSWYDRQTFDDAIFDYGDESFYISDGRSASSLVSRIVRRLRSQND